MKSRGFTLIEVISVALMMTIIGGISVASLKKTQIRNRKLEAKTELGFIYQAQRTYLLKNRESLNDGIQEIVFPKGTKRYNVGFVNIHNPRSSRQAHNYMELCDDKNGEKIDGNLGSYNYGGDPDKPTNKRADDGCKFIENKADIEAHVDKLQMPPGAHCPDKEETDETLRYKFTAYAVGNISDTSLAEVDKLKINRWKIDDDEGSLCECEPESDLSAPCTCI